MCASDRLIKQRNNLHFSTTAYIQGIPFTPRQHRNRLNSAGNGKGLVQNFHNHILSDHKICDKNEYKMVFYKKINPRTPRKLRVDHFFSF